MSWRIVRALGVLRPFIPQWRFFGKWRASPTSDQHPKWTSVDNCDGLLSIRELLQDNERIELEKLLRDIDQFSEAFKAADRERSER